MTRRDFPSFGLDAKEHVCLRCESPSLVSSRLCFRLCRNGASVETDRRTIAFRPFTGKPGNGRKNQSSLPYLDNTERRNSHNGNPALCRFPGIGASRRRKRPTCVCSASWFPHMHVNGVNSLCSKLEITNLTGYPVDGNPRSATRTLPESHLSQLLFLCETHSMVLRFGGAVRVAPLLGVATVEGFGGVVAGAGSTTFASTTTRLVSSDFLGFLTRW